MHALITIYIPPSFLKSFWSGTKPPPWPLQPFHPILDDMHATVLPFGSFLLEKKKHTEAISCARFGVPSLSHFGPPISANRVSRSTPQPHAAETRSKAPCSSPLLPSLWWTPDLGQGVHDNLSSRGLAIGLSLDRLVQLLLAKIEINHLLQLIVAAQSTQPAVTTLVDARGIPVVLAIYGHDSLPRPARHCFRSLAVYLVATLVHSLPRLANRTPAHANPNLEFWPTPLATELDEPCLALHSSRRAW
jgi:hypothetical protein